jgi:Zn-dependent M28 family amino/carboxypeptidase
MLVGSPWSSLTFWLGVLLSLPLLILAWGIGLNMSLGRLRAPSQGAVDNGAACAILLGLACQVQDGEVQLDQTRLTLALFTGEEVNMQGSRAYVKSREWPLPSLAVNLEVMAQDGAYVLWDYDGTSLELAPTSEVLNGILRETIEELTGVSPVSGGPVNSDAYSFIRNGIPATTLGTYDKELVDRGFHGPEDNLDRVVIERLPEAVSILTSFIQRFDRGLTQFPPRSSELDKIYSYPE